MPTKQTHEAVSMDMRALLIGIDTYLGPGVPRLNGCVNDIDAVYTVLTRNLLVKPDHIAVLKNEQATRAAIIAALTDLAKRTDIHSDTQVLIHFSGHGSQMQNQDRSEPDGFDETIVSHDARTKGPNGYIFDIPDKTLAGIIEQLARKTPYITVILDCCHSGSGTRSLDDDRPPVRRAPQELRIPPADLDEAIRSNSGNATRGDSGWAKSEPTHVLLAGCLDKEESNEYSGPHARQGALTYFWLEYLRQMPTDATYADAHAWVKTRVNAIYRTQTPQCEGDKTRTIFGGARFESDPFIEIKRIAGPRITLNGGLLLGLGKGARLNVFPGTTTARAKLGKPLAQLEVVSAGALESVAEVVPPEADADAGAARAPAMPNPPFDETARCLVTFAVFGTERMRVWLNEKSFAKADYQDLKTRIEQDDLLLNSDRDTCAVKIDASADGFILTDTATGKLMVEPGSVVKSNDVYQALRAIGRWRIVQSLANKNPTQLNGKIKLDLHPCLEVSADGFAEKYGKSIASAPQANQKNLVLNIDAKSLDSHAFVPVVTNASSQPVYVSLMLLNQDFSIVRLYPFGDEPVEALAPGANSPLVIGAVNGRGSILDATPPPGWARSDDQLKLFVSTNPIDLRQLEQSALMVPATRGARSRGLAGTLEDIAHTGTRGQPMRRTEGGEDWTVIDLPYTAIQGLQESKLEAGAKEVSLGHGFKLIKPSHLTGKARLGTTDAVTRSESDRPQLPLEVLSRLPDFQPLRISKDTRGSVDDGIVIEFELDRGATRGDPEPLAIALPDEFAAQSKDIVPLAFDGEDFLIAGYGDEGEIKLTDLPDSAVPQEVQGTGPTKRGLLNTIRLYLLVKMGRPAPDLGLHRVTLVDGKAVYNEIEQGFLKNQRATVAVLVHGFTSDSRWLVRDIPVVSGVQYDHLLAWDYETFGTGIDKNGKELAFALINAGLSEGDDVTVHVYSHSMGTLVTRCMVELHEGYKLVDKVVLAGPPNKGTPLANESRGLLFLITEAINLAGAGTVLKSSAWAGKKLHGNSAGWEDLMTTSDLIDALWSADEPKNIQYLVLAGTNSASTERAARLQRLWRKCLDQGADIILGEPQNDLVIGLSSMSKLRGKGSSAKLEQVTCDHFGYYADDHCINAIRNWIK